MPDQHTRLRDVLTQKKPNIPYGRPPSKDTRNEHWPNVKHSITLWSDFNLTNLNESYGQILDLPIPAQLQLPPAPSRVLAGVTINRNTDICHLTSWNDQIIHPTVDFARRELGIEPGIGLDHIASTADRKVLAKLPVNKPHTVDHIIMLDDLQPLVVGIGRTTRWSARKLIRQLPNPSDELLWPVRQLAQLCRYGKTRYGYIQTKEELVVCRFSEGHGQGDGNWKIAIQSIPWARNGCDALTTDLALWWLNMLAISGQHHRAIVREEDVVSISAWDTVYLDQERGWVRRHQYSHLEVPTSPPLPHPYQISTLGNITTFNTEASFDAMEGIQIDKSNMEDTFQAGVNNDDFNVGMGCIFQGSDDDFFSKHNIANSESYPR